jgi:hypothetical protein
MYAKQLVRSKEGNYRNVSKFPEHHTASNTIEYSKHLLIRINWGGKVIQSKE